MKQQYCDSGIRPQALPIALWLHIVTLVVALALFWTDMTPVLGKVKCTHSLAVIVLTIRIRCLQYQ